MRDPSIHILRSNLIQILSDLGISSDLQEKIIQGCVDHRVTNRWMVNKVKKGAKEKQSQIIGRVNFFLDGFRRDQRHKNISPIIPGEPEWVHLNKLAYCIEEFAILFQIEFDTAIRYYLLEGLKMLGHRYTLQKLSTYKTKIFQKYKEESDVAQDPTPELSRAIHKQYESYLRNPVEFGASFVYTAEQIYELPGVDYKVWVQAQFEKFREFNSIPEPYQLYGVNALARYKSFIQGIKTRVPKSTERANQKIEEIKNVISSRK